MNVNIIGVPIFFGCDREGVECGPEKLREKHIVEVIKKSNHTVYDLGNLYVPKVDKKDKFLCHEKMKYLSPIVEVNTNLAEQVHNSLASGNFPFVIGGDHSLGLGSISGASKCFDNLGVIWIDAHGDINTYETTPSGNVHGMPLSAAMGIGYSDLTDLYYKGQKIKPENVFIIGARDLDKGEVKIIRDNKLNVWTTDDIQSKGVSRTMEELHELLLEKGLKNIHVSFDIDALDSSIVPGTGTPVDKGMSVDEVKHILKYILDTKLVKSMDFVELNSKLDKGTQTLDTAVNLVDWVFKNLK